MQVSYIDGEAKDATHGGEIDIVSWSCAMTQSGSMHKGGGSGKPMP
ncbi:MAG: type VI secretion system tube protein Hcp [Gammaproteobacteria bacterium]|nr:type VI secretion system tube protein Hcp [Gammaproteobacteria bacterium]